MNSDRTLFVALLVSFSVLSGFPNVARAVCPSTPKDYASASCDSRCDWPDSTTWRCSVVGCDASSVTVVANYGTAGRYQAWGQCGTDLFCCETDVLREPTTFVVYGTTENDVLGFTWDNGTYDLEPADGLAISAIIYANGGDDTIKGSYATTDYSESLNGEDDNDTILCADGNDEADGGEGNDFVNGASGNDTLHGGEDDDTLLGGSGDDHLYGDDGQDILAGGANGDHLDGGEGGDILCGDDGGDYLDDGDTIDEIVYTEILWGSTMFDDDTCGHSTTKWDGNATEHGTCGDVVTSRPEQCP